MGIPAPEKAKLEIRMSNEGRLEAYWNGDRLPVFEVDITHVRGERAEVSLRFAGPSVKLSTEPDAG